MCRKIITQSPKKDIQESKVDPTLWQRRARDGATNLTMLRGQLQLFKMVEREHHTQRSVIQSGSRRLSVTLLQGACYWRQLRVTRGTEARSSE
jgi:hypothetical protein